MTEWLQNVLEEGHLIDLGVLKSKEILKQKDIGLEDISEAKNYDCYEWLIMEISIC